MKNISKKLFALLAIFTLTAGIVPLAAVAQSKAAGIDIAGMDKTVRPGDDFFMYANGTWYKNTEIPADRSSLGAFNAIDDMVKQRTESLIEQAGKAKDPESQAIAAYYRAYMDTEAIEKLGLSPIKSGLAKVAAIRDVTELSRYLGSQLRADVDPLNMTNFYTPHLFGLFVSPNFTDPKKNVPYLLQGGLGMEERDVYLKDDDRSKTLREKYVEHIAKVLKLANIGDAEAKAHRIFALELKIANVHAGPEESADVHKANNPWKREDFAKKAPGMDWNAYFTAAKLDKEPLFIVWQPGATTGESALVGSEPLSTWKEYLTFRLIDGASPLLPKAFADESFDFYGRTAYGLQQQSPRNLRAVDATSNALGDAVGKLYVQKYFPAKAKRDIQTLVKNIVAAFGKRVDALDWMSPETKAKAKEKLGTLYVGVGYPDKFRSYKGLVIKDNDPIGNAQRVGLFDYEWNLARLHQPVDKTLWWITPQTVNALNLPLQNALNFPAAILNPPFFDMDADPVENYGAIGAVIGHEISHSFDNLGSEFDAYGKMTNWWTPADFEHFKASGARLAAQFDAYEPLPGVHVNGNLTLGENIADVAGLSAAYDAYRAAYQGKEAPAKNGFTGDQRFFLAFGQAWRGKMRPQTLRVIVATNGHAPGEFRADTARNLDAWYKAFDVKPGEKLYLAPKDRVRVW
ncbi:MAG: endothelin-converting protein 1 [Acidobacteria bacterium OLB17]|nr:MAG: endothelin-converting protein 1 [Acidobacteria bacterium OLB17]MCZ2390861.1 M13 family metallopeptidase [Acidobacteriota bacterium]